MRGINVKPSVYNLIPLFIWFLLLLLPFLSSAPPHISAADHHRFLLHILISNSLLLVVFYIHTYLIYPFRSSKLGRYLAGVATLFLFYGLGEYFLNLILDKVSPPGNHFIIEQGVDFAPPMHGPDHMMQVLSLFIALLCSFCYRVIIDNTEREQLLQDRETAHLRTELSFLRSQINPHFLFNILNSLTALARKKSDKLEPAIVNLSQLMRYMLYESDNNKVSLKKELTYLTSYIDLQLLRFGDSITVKTDFSGNYEACQIEPMLLIPLVENAFKHGADVQGDNTIFLSLKIPDDCKSASFKLQNFFDKNDKAAGNDHGIGLKNIKRRLDILYPGKHDFKTYAIGDLYTSELSIDFS